MYESMPGRGKKTGKSYFGVSMSDRKDGDGDGG